MKPPEIHGKCEEKFSAVRDAFASNFEGDSEVGASFAATIDGELVVDLWGGYADRDRTHPWEPDTIANVWSTTKAVTSTCVHMLVDRGLVDIYAPIASYWPEFGQAGKEQIPVRNVLSHRAGVAAITHTSFPTEAIYDWETMTAAIASQAPLWEPGTRHGYHAFTFGFILGEVIRRITGKTIGAFANDEIAEPLNADFYIGVPSDKDSLVAQTIPPTMRYNRPPSGTSGTDEPPPRINTNNPPITPTIPNRREWRAAEIPGGNGHGNARGLARIMSALALGGEVGGVRLMSADTIENAIVQQAYGPDLVLRDTMRWSLGYILYDAQQNWNSQSKRVFGHSGWGGSLAVADMDNRVGWAYVMNKMQRGTTGDERSAEIARALYESLQ